MQEDEVLKIAIAETSMIVRSGLALVLKRIQGLKILPIELVSEESLDECVRFHKPEILIVNPSFTGYFDVRKFKETPQNAGVKCIALMCSVADQGVLRNYDESLTIYDDADTIREKLNRLLNVPGEETEEELAGQEVLSSREKEIITCVVKGMTNKEIADALYLSAHTETIRDFLLFDFNRSSVFFFRNYRLFRDIDGQYTVFHPGLNLLFYHIIGQDHRLLEAGI